MEWRDKSVDASKYLRVVSKISIGPNYIERDIYYYLCLPSMAL